MGVERLDQISSPQRPGRYSEFTKIEKWIIISIVSYATWFSGLSSFIYYPAINALSETLSVSIEKINLTITSYLAVATVAPAMFGDFADVLGRRPVYLMTLSLYFVANVSIALSKTYSALIGLRALQALAISGTNAFVYGVIADIASPAERGSFVSVVSFRFVLVYFISMNASVQLSSDILTLISVTIGPSVGPIIGGLLTYAAGWPWIFWFLCIAAGLCLVLVIFLLPETCRQVVGSGLTPPPRYSRLPYQGFMHHWKGTNDQQSRQSKTRTPNPLKSITILFRRDNTVVIFAAGLLYLVYTQGLPTDKIAGDDLGNFPIEKARLSVMWTPLAITILALVAYGWVVHYRRHIALPLVLQFILGMSLQFVFSIYNTLLTDKNHNAAAAAQASSNLIRCTLATIAVAFLQKMLDIMGAGWTYTLLSALSLMAMVLFCIDYRMGTKWRQAALEPCNP
ncbi:uncharacterized protein CLUP02_07491 [Colletotrichum lupini]|uniref:Major facilitator superfamily (MFS) profile domain-containing protein n=1 Tax=Colletotrichum lupini TaxID=145971 RepID=A0A9Q8SRC0_9PEZI|nr:uncharacterized protein CLUP02_07491 [Colletotrichum lupini]UQC82005.1 hypothetical protein CLUP02_07491 [Colletotrichum lupini]